MGVALTMIGVAVLLVLVAISLKRQHEERVAERRIETDRHDPAAQAQHDESLQRRASVRAAHAERARLTNAEPGAVGPDAKA